jgi:beta-glucosidase/6-phospho-beta-glucosidase/beta-galactosidase
LADNWEWSDGFSTRFGVSFTEKDEDGRVVKYWAKKSAQVIADWFETHMTLVNS